MPTWSTSKAAVSAPLMWFSYASAQVDAEVYMMKRFESSLFQIYLECDLSYAITVVSF